MWRDSRKGTYEIDFWIMHVSISFWTDLLWGAIWNFLFTLFCKIWIIEKEFLNAFRALAISSIARRVNFHFWIEGPFFRIALHIYIYIFIHSKDENHFYDQSQAFISFTTKFASCEVNQTWKTKIRASVLVGKNLRSKRKTVEFREISASSLSHP